MGVLILYWAHRSFQRFAGLWARRGSSAKAYARFQRHYRQQREAARARHGQTQHIDKAQRETLHAALAGGKPR
ncbi:hypothetical protein [Brevundimonas sp.]|uniref:hypothetical protein n=1 Tax=Brevundimonas sp. TaxID=1871086 RepID=UPI00289D44DF|nr:hypothetical protein [Brevundimonas sp.]